MELNLFAKIPLRGPLTALLIASLILSAVTSLFGTKVRSIKDTFGVGTLIAVPSNFPLGLVKQDSLLLLRQ